MSPMSIFALIVILACTTGAATWCTVGHAWGDRVANVAAGAAGTGAAVLSGCVAATTSLHVGIVVLGAYSGLAVAITFCMAARQWVHVYLVR